MGLFSWCVKTDPVVHRQIRKLFSKMFMYLLKTCKRFYLYSNNTTNISNHYLKQKMGTKMRLQKKLEAESWFLCPHFRPQKEINEIVNFQVKIVAYNKAKQKLDSKSLKIQNNSTNETGKLIVNSLRLLHETFLYFEIGSNQVANNDNNFCNKIKPRWANPHEFNNFAMQEHIFLF